ncbi:MAG: glycoside hydrolase family 20 zincin-like fold domain-containing protein, partial [Planctomycetota bacterium]
MAKLKLLPAPKSVRQRKGSFKVEDGLPVLIAPGSDKEINAAWSFAGEAEDRLDRVLPVERMGKLDGIRPRFLFLIAGRDEALYPKLARLAEGLDKAPAEVRDQAYVLKVTKTEVVAAAETPQGLYYAAQTLRQLLQKDGRIPCVTITDWPTYRYRGVMLDISRFRVPALDSLFERIERLAALKINVFQLYTEHTFVFRRHPEIGANCGSMSAEDIIALDEFCKEHFVDLNANLQSFGHHRHLLSIPAYNDLAERHDEPWTLCPVDERTYDLLDDLYAECLPAYSSPLFNASCDETWELGTGRSAEKAEAVGVGRVY